jgi:hypothetical protein
MHWAMGVPALLGALCSMRYALCHMCSICTAAERCRGRCCFLGPRRFSGPRRFGVANSTEGTAKYFEQTGLVVYVLSFSYPIAAAVGTGVKRGDGRPMPSDRPPRPSPAFPRLALPPPRTCVVAAAPPGLGVVGEPAPGLQQLPFCISQYQAGMSSGPRWMPGPSSLPFEHTAWGLLLLLSLFGTEEARVAPYATF